jgi:hypothetical protein
LEPIKPNPPFVSSSKKIYRIAEKYDIEQLKEALEDIKHQEKLSKTRRSREREG